MRLRTRQQYRRMAQQTFKFTGHWILADIRVTQGPFSRLGITVTRRYGSAYQRNRFKRITREAFRLSYPYLKIYFDIVIRPRSQALCATQQDIQQELLQFVERAIRIFSSRENSQIKS